MRILIATDGTGKVADATQLVSFIANLAPSQVHLLGVGGASAEHLNGCLQLLAKADVLATVTQRDGNPVDVISDQAAQAPYELVVLAADRRAPNALLQPARVSQLLRSVNSHLLLTGTDQVLPRRILLPLGSSYQSRRAVRYMAPLARALNAQVDLIHVMSGEVSGPTPRVNPSSALARSLEWQRRILADQGVQHTLSVRRGPEPEVLNMTRMQEGHDLVVLSAHPRQGLLGFFLGDSSRQLLEHLPGPTLIVRSTEAESGLWQTVRTAVGRWVANWG